MLSYHLTLTLPPVVGGVGTCPLWLAKLEGLGLVLLKAAALVAADIVHRSAID